MAYVLRKSYSSYNWLFNEYKDPRVENYPFLGAPLPIFALIILYVYFVKVWGPKWMERRTPFELTYVLYVYNLIQIIANLLIGGFGLYYSYMQKDFSWTCQPVDKTMKNPVVLATYFYYISKIVDLLDTVFFVLRKKNKQITFLHVYHHSGMVFATYIYAKFLAGSHGTLLGVLNSFVHVVMYSYYFYTSIYPNVPRLWWKKYITQLQLIQFAILFIHFLNPILFFQCAYPKEVAFTGAVQNFFMFVLFADFYYKTYIRRKPVQL